MEGGMKVSVTKAVEIYKINADEITVQKDEMLSEFRLQVIFRENTDTLFCSGFQLPELAAGFLYTEYGVDIGRKGYEIRLEEAEDHAIITIEEPKAYSEPEGAQTSGGMQPPSGDVFLSYREIDEWMTAFSQQSQLFAATGNVHSAGFVSGDGAPGWFCEDIGRHNALDKLIGKALLQNTVLSEGVVFLSGRVPSDIMHKLIRAGVTVAVSVSAPTLDSVRMAGESGMTLIGFARKNRMNVYSHPERIVELKAIGEEI